MKVEKDVSPLADKDTITKAYMQDHETFADVFNFLLYDGKQIIKPEQLRPLDTAAIALPYGESEMPVPVQKYRDILNMVTAMEDDDTAYLLLGIENQSDMHYAMPVRDMLYDALQYVQQIEFAARSHRQGSVKPESKAEFLSGFYRTDRLLPVVTLTLYFGADEWTAPKSLHEMLSVKDENILKFISDYRMNLIAPADIADEDFAKFHTELNQALKYVKYSKDKQKLRQMMQEDAAYKTVTRRTADMVNIVTGSNLRYTDGEERVDMCEAIEEMRKDAMNEGKIEGILSTLSDLVRKGLLTLAQAAEQAGMTVPEFEAKAGLR